MNHEGLARYSDWGWGFIDRRGRVVIDAKFHEAPDFAEGMAFVSLLEKSKFGYLNQKGKLVIPFQYERACDFHDGLAAVKRSNDAYAFINQTGKVVLHSKSWLEIDDLSRKG